MSRFLLIFTLMLVMSMQVCCISKQFVPELYKRTAYNQVAMIMIEFEIHDLVAKTVSHPTIQATAFAVDKTYLATAGHFCVGAFEMAMQSKNLKTTMTYVDGNEELTTVNDFKIVAIDVKNDLCVIEKPMHRLIPVKLAKDFRPKIRDKVYTVGAPRGTFPIETQGYISSPFIFSENEDLNGKVLCSLAIYSGNSGSPAYNDSGEVIGVIVMGDKIYPNVAIYTPIKYLVTLMIEVAKQKSN